MELLLVLAAVIGLLVGFDAAALAFGADSRDGVGDDWARRIGA